MLRFFHKNVPVLSQKVPDYSSKVDGFSAIKWALSRQIVTVFSAKKCPVYRQIITVFLQKNTRLLTKKVTLYSTKSVRFLIKNIQKDNLRYYPQMPIDITLK